MQQLNSTEIAELIKNRIESLTLSAKLVTKVLSFL